jgi:flagellar motility protein MotE (MotC chaperone)
MGKYFLGVFTVILLIVLGAGGIWLFDFAGVIALDDLAIRSAANLPGLSDLPASYALGKKRSVVLKKKEEELVAREKRLAAERNKLEEDSNALVTEKKQWLKERNTLFKAASGQSTQTSEGLDPAVKKYLATVGAMKPAKAAAVIQQLPDATVFALFDQLKSARASKIMENLPAEYLTRITRARMNSAKK